MEIDNNLIENAVRPLAIGRRNFLFCGSHEAAQMAAGMYSFMACCKKNNINEFEWQNMYCKESRAISKKTCINSFPQIGNSIAITQSPEIPKTIYMGSSDGCLSNPKMT